VHHEDDEKETLEWILEMLRYTNDYISYYSAKLAHGGLASELDELNHAKRFKRKLMSKLRTWEEENAKQESQSITPSLEVEFDSKLIQIRRAFFGLSDKPQNDK